MKNMMFHKKWEIFNRVCNFAKQIFLTVFKLAPVTRVAKVFKTWVSLCKIISTITFIFPMKGPSPKPLFRSRIGKWDMVFHGNIVPVIGI